MALALSALSFGSTVLFCGFPNMPFFIFDCLCVFAPMSGYIDQLRRMISTKMSSNFQTGSSLILLFSNFMRILYWAGNRFAYYLLFQSVFTVLIHMLLCLFYFKYRDVRGKDMSQQERSGIIRQLWHLFDVDTAVEFFLVLAICFTLMASVTLILGCITNFRFVSEMVGLISNLIDSLTTLPPFITIVLHNDISCTTTLLILQYISGTCLKAVLFLCRPVPWPFRVGLAVQAFLNLCIVVQFIRITIQSRTEFAEEEETTDSEAEEEEDFSDDEINPPDSRTRNLFVFDHLPIENGK